MSATKLPGTAVFLSIALWGVTFLCYLFRLDFCAALTAIPAWVWLVPGVFLVFTGYLGGRKRSLLFALALWFVYPLIIVAETKSVFRAWFDPRVSPEKNRADKNMIRVISLNCAGSGCDSAAEFIPYRPDLVLLQESPAKEIVEKITKALYGDAGEFLWGIDTSIIINGKILSVKTRKDFCYASHALVKLQTGRELEVICFRPPPPPLRFDLWSPGCWRAHLNDRNKKKEQIKTIGRMIGQLPGNAAVLLGGDFNMPAGDGALKILKPYLCDTFKKAGYGWGNTVSNELPVHRYDQIWANERIAPVYVAARATKHSDHRLVIADLIVK